MFTELRSSGSDQVLGEDKEIHGNVAFDVTVRCLKGDVEWVTEYVDLKFRKEAQVLKPLRQYVKPGHKREEPTGRG